MRKLTDNDLKNIAGSTVQGHYVEDVRITRGQFSDSDHYGVILGQSEKGCYVTWAFHLDEDDKVSVYWGHYFICDRDAAIRDFNTRDEDGHPELSSSYWDCQCEEKYIHPNSSDKCPECGAERYESPDSQQDEVDSGTHFFSGSPETLDVEKIIDEIKNHGARHYAEIIRLAREQEIYSKLGYSTLTHANEIKSYGDKYAAIVQLMESLSNRLELGPNLADMRDRGAKIRAEDLII